MAKFHSFAGLLYTMLKSEHGRHSVRSVAQNLAVQGQTFSDKTVDAWTRNERAVPADALAPLYELTGDIRVLTWLPGQFGYHVVRLPAAEPLKKLALLEALGNLMGFLSALASGRGSPEELIAEYKLRKRLDELLAGLLALREKLKHG